MSLIFLDIYINIFKKIKTFTYDLENVTLEFVILVNINNINLHHL